MYVLCNRRVLPGLAAMHLEKLHDKIERPSRSAYAHIVIGSTIRSELDTIHRYS
jgi:hypothetical protein